MGYIEADRSLAINKGANISFNKMILFMEGERENMYMGRLFLT